MSVQGSEMEKIYLPMYLYIIVIMVFYIYYYCYEVFISFGLVYEPFDVIVAKVHEIGFLGEYATKLVVLLMTFCLCIVKSGKPVETKWWILITGILISALIFFCPYFNDGLFLVTTLTGFISLLFWIARLGRKVNGFKGKVNDVQETFEQMNDIIDTDYSINMPLRYKYKGRFRKGWVNVVNPFRGSLLYGVPGSGKSYSVYYQFIDQMIRKGFTMFVYDYKFPDLTELVYNKWLQYYPQVKKEGKMVPPEGTPMFCMLNFDDPTKSLRCNPLDARYLTDMSDAHEVADIIMKNVDPKSIGKEDFFSMSAKVYIAALVWFLKKYKNGRYCSFPHLIELLGQDYKKVFKLLQEDEEIRVMIQPFADALSGHAEEQLQGQIASARIPLLKFPSPVLYWALTGNDFTLDINNPLQPKIVCMGNNPKRQAIYGTALALYTSRLFKIINAKGKRPCGVMLDELPTIFIKGLDNLIATARSNKVAILMGAQDKSQLVRDYSREEATVIINTVGNVIAGQVNGDTAKELSEMFGEEWREEQSQSLGSSDSITRSYHLQKILPQSHIETLTQGWFVGKVADDNKTPILKKLFAGELIIDNEARAEEEKNYKKIPEQGLQYFELDKVEAYVIKNVEKSIKTYLEKIRQEELDRANIEEDPIFVAQYAEKKFAELDPKSDEYKDILNKTTDFYKQKHIDDILQENYKRIKNDIENIMIENADIIEGAIEREKKEKGDPVHNGSIQN